MAVICQVLQLPRSSYYARQAAVASQKQVDDEVYTHQIREIFTTHRGCYGARRIQAELRRQGTAISLGRVRRLMAAAGLRAIQPRSFIPHTSDGKASAPSPNLLLESALPTAPDQVWAADFTYIPVAGGWAFLAIVLDHFSRRVVGWQLRSHMRAELVTSALQRAIYQRQPARGLICHSDRGSQYGSHLYRDELAKSAVRQSMSAVGNPYHNALVESFFSRFKAELIQDGSFCDLNDAHTAIFDYIECYHNRQRLHSALGNVPPEEFEDHYWLCINQQAA